MKDKGQGFAWLAIRPRITLAFRKLQAQGYVARQSFSCCRGCAGAALATWVGERDERIERCKGAVFYTRQAAQALRGGRQVQALRLYLNYGPVVVEGVTYGKDVAAVGRDVAAALKAEGLEVEWDGSGETAIVITGLDTALWDASEAAAKLGGDSDDVLFTTATRKQRNKE